MTMRRTGILIAVLLAFFIFGVAAGDPPGTLYSKAIQAAKRGKKDIAFVHFLAILERHPGCDYIEEAMMGAAEYYYSIGDYRDAPPLFKRLISEFPESRAKLFALAYLFKLSKESEKEDLVKKLRKEIITFKQQSFLFRVFKNYQYRSPLYMLHKAVYYIDRVEFYIDEELFAEIPF